MDDLVSLYLKSKRGRQIIACFMSVPIKFCRIEYINHEQYVKTEIGLLKSDSDELAQYRAKLQKQYADEAKIKFAISDEDCILTREKALKLIEEEKVNEL